MYPTITEAIANERRRDQLVRSAAARRARLVQESVVPQAPRATAATCQHRTRFGAVRAWLALGQL
jgi:hypothetical protein